MLTTTTYRQAAITAQQLTSNVKSTRLSDLLSHLSYVQIDSINVVERAHHHTLWTRLPDFRPQDLHDLQTKDRTVFEYWGHAMSYLPMADYRYYLPRMRGFDEPHGKWERNRLAKYGKFMPQVLDRIRAEGPLSSKDLKGVPLDQRREGVHPKPMRAAMELLHWQGELMVSGRRKSSERIFDLTERVLPDWVDTTLPSDEEVGRFCVQRALQAHGFMTERDILNHLHATDKKTISAALKQMVSSAEVIEVKPVGNEKHIYYALPNTIEQAESHVDTEQDVHILCPFDNLIINRDRTRRLFGFDYALECYTPPAKRIFGYYVMPVLWGGRFVARFDPKADRKKKTLRIINLIFEAEFNEFDNFLPAFAQKLEEFATFNNCREISIETVKPAKWKAPLKKLIRKLLPT